MLKNKKILIGVTGSIAVYKTLDLVRRLRAESATVQVIMTDAAQKFVTPLAFEVASQHTVYTNTFQEPLSHISLAAEADLMVIAPATANIIGKFAQGIGDDMLSTCLLSFTGKVILAPAMNWRMYDNFAVQRNISDLASRGVVRVGPERGTLACDDEGIGRMSDVDDIMEAARSVLARKDLEGKRLMVTAGPTREYIDPVRFISNRSSGKMGYAIARAASRRGADVMLISGPSTLRAPSAVRFVPVESAHEMRGSVMKNIHKTDILVMAAAVADFRPEEQSHKKIDKSSGLLLKLKQTPDILAEVGSMKRKPFIVGFAAETGNDLGRARKKLMNKGADIMVFNNVIARGSGFDVDTNEITIIERTGQTAFSLMTKDEAADLILDRISSLLS